MVGSDIPPKGGKEGPVATLKKSGLIGPFLVMLFGMIVGTVTVIFVPLPKSWPRGWFVPTVFVALISGVGFAAFVAVYLVELARPFVAKLRRALRQWKAPQGSALMSYCIAAALGFVVGPMVFTIVHRTELARANSFYLIMAELAAMIVGALIAVALVFAVRLAYQTRYRLAWRLVTGVRFDPKKVDEVLATLASAIRAPTERDGMLSYTKFREKRQRFTSAHRIARALGSKPRYAAPVDYQRQAQRPTWRRA